MLNLNLKEESICQVNEQRKAGFNCPLAASRPEAAWIRCPLLTKRFAVPWNKQSALAPHVCWSKDRGKAGSVLHVSAGAMGWVYFPALHTKMTIKGPRQS